MQADEIIAGSARGPRLWIGWTLSGLVIAFMAMDITLKLLALPVVLETSAQIGFKGASLARGLGILLLICTVAYALPRTAVLGAILMTGYLGGAIAAQLRAGNPLFTHVLFGVYLGALAWLGLYLREPRLRELFASSAPTDT